MDWIAFSLVSAGRDGDTGLHHIWQLVDRLQRAARPAPHFAVLVCAKRRWRAACPLRPQALAIDVVDEDAQIYEFCLPGTIPNSAPCLIEFIASPPALAGPITLALEACTCNNAQEKSGGVEGLRPRPCSARTSRAAKPRRVAGVVSGEISLDLSGCGRRDLAVSGQTSKTATI